MRLIEVGDIMALFDYTRTMGDEVVKPMEHSVSKDAERIVEEPATTPVAVQKDATSVVSNGSEVVDKSIEKELLIRLHGIDNQDVYVDEGSSKARLVRIPDHESDLGYGVLMLDKSCIEPAVNAKGGLMAGFSDVVVSTDGTSLMGHYFRFENTADGDTKTVHSDVTPQYLQDEWNRVSAEQVAKARETTQKMASATMVEEERQYGTE